MLHSVKSRVCTCTDNKLAQKPEKFKKKNYVFGSHSGSDWLSLPLSALALYFHFIHCTIYSPCSAQNALARLSAPPPRWRFFSRSAPLQVVPVVTDLTSAHWALNIDHRKKELTWGEVRSRGPSWQLVRYCLSQRAGLFSSLFLSWSPALLDLPSLLWSI